MHTNKTETVNSNEVVKIRLDFDIKKLLQFIQDVKNATPDDRWENIFIVATQSETEELAIRVFEKDNEATVVEQLQANAKKLTDINAELLKIIAQMNAQK